MPDIQLTTPKVGIYVSSIKGGMRDGALGWRDILAMARRAEELGFASFSLPDHLLFRFEGEPPHGPWECWSLLAALAAATSTIELASVVACTGFRNPALLAKMADTVDEISGGRLILGLGAGWHEPEYEAFGFPYDHRFARFEEAVVLVRTLLREGRVDHQGTYYQARDCELRPRGPRPQGPPVMIGSLASGPRMARLIARHADVWNGWLVGARSYADQIPAMREVFDAACAEIGRDPASLERTVGIAIDQRPELDLDKPVHAYPDETPIGPAAYQPLVGGPEVIADELRRFAAEGISHVQVAPVLDGLAGIEALAPVLASLRRG